MIFYIDLPLSRLEKVLEIVKFYIINWGILYIYICVSIVWEIVLWFIILFVKKY